MTSENYPGNSRSRAGQPSENNPTSGEGQPKLEKVVTGKVVHRKKPLGRRVRDTLFSGDGGVISYIVLDVLVPHVQNLIIDMVKQGIEKAVRGEVTPTGRTFRENSPYRQPHNYNGYSNQTTISRSPMAQQPPARRPLSQPSSNDFDDIVLDSQFAANTIGEKLYERIEEYGWVSVAGLRELLGETPTTIDYKWGWLEGVEFLVKRVRLDNRQDGFLLVVPDPVHLNQNT